MRACIVLCCVLIFSGCGSSRTARNGGATPETRNASGQIELASGNVVGAPAPSTKVGVSKPYMLKAPT